MWEIFFFPQRVGYVEWGFYIFAPVKIFFFSSLYFNGFFMDCFQLFIKKIVGGKGGGILKAAEKRREGGI